MSRRRCTVFNRCDEFGFWIYPHSDSLKRVPFGLLVNEQFFKFKLKPGIWQRVATPLARGDNAPYFNPRHYMFVALKPNPGDLVRNGKMPSEITYEINETYATSNSIEVDSWRVWKDTEDGRLYLAVLGSAGETVAYRHRFPELIRIADVRYHCISNGKKPRMAFSKATQMLEFNNIRLPEDIPENAAQYFTGRDIARCREKGLTMFVASMEIDD